MEQRDKIEKESFLYGANAPYILDLYHRYQTNPNDISQDWRSFFEKLGPSSLLGDDRPPQWSAEPSKTDRTQPSAQQSTSSDFSSQTRDSIRALMMIRVYRVRGHLRANLDPLGIDKHPLNPELDPATYGFTPSDYDRPIFMDGVLGFDYATIPQIMEKLKKTYCSTVGVEFMHIQDPAQKAWIQERMENSPSEGRTTPERQYRICKELVQADSFERFLHVKFPGEKRFGLEGGESLIPALDAFLSAAAKAGLENIMFGMAHRGRLSVLANILKKPVHLIFSKFNGGHVGSELDFGSGDVKYHLGFSVDRDIDGRSIHLSLTSNPSHLEAVDPVVLGKVRSEQTRTGDTQRARVMGVLIHGDAAFCGQGLVAETLELSGLKGYRTGGCLHIIINNQIGFTTSPPHSRSSPYSSDIAKAIQAPIFHVNGDDPEAVVWVMDMAFEFRQQFALDVVVDIICYRRHGHNEVDEPAFTQPLMYKSIAQHPTTAKLYTQQLLNAQLITSDQIDKIVDSYESDLQAELDRAAQLVSTEEKSEPDWLKGHWMGIKSVDINQENESESQPPTGVSLEILQEIATNLCRVPENLHIHQRLNRVLEGRRKISESGENIDWAIGEALAIGSLLLEGNPARLSGQDVGRGTFSQRHAVWIDQETEEKYIALNNIRPNQSEFEVVDSPLAEASVLGFEYGYSAANPRTLVIWEAQFGDFANGAQVIIDQFISSGELKWLRMSGLVMLLPHGFEGQGPEHSSARVERYLQLCAQSNMRVANCTTPANFFHLLRRQLRSDTRKPLIVATPKSILRHPKAVSTFSDMITGTQFSPVFDDATVTTSQVKQVVMCSGKVYYDLLEEREKQGRMDVALIRIEQYYPFPESQLTRILNQYKSAQFIWCQEEPKNMGAWMFLDRRLESVLRGLGSQEHIHYAGRPPAASPATGVMGRHLEEQRQLIQEALTPTRTTKKGLFAIKD